MIRTLLGTVLLAVLVISPITLSEGSPEETEGCGECCSTDFDNCPIKEDNPVKDTWVICQFTHLATTRTGKATFLPKNVDPELCTHIYFGNAWIDRRTHTLVPGTDHIEIGEAIFTQVTDLKAKGPKVMLIIYLNYKKTWSETIRDENRPKFIKSVVDMLQKHNFDGVNIHFPSDICPMGKAKDGPRSYDKHVMLYKELKAALNGKYTLSVDLPSRKKYIKRCSSMKELSNLVDWINLQTNQYHYWTEHKTGAQAPMCGTEEDYGVYNTLKFYMDTYSYPPDKVTLGINFYGSTFALANKDSATFGAPVKGPGEYTEFLRTEGFSTYYEACLHVKNDKWTLGTSKMNGEFIYKDNQFISTPSVADIKRKVCLIKKFKLKGANIWSIDFDDFHGMCGCGQYPLLKTLNKELLRKGTDVNCVL